MVGVQTILTLKKNEIIFLKKQLLKLTTDLNEKINEIRENLNDAEYVIEVKKYKDILDKLHKQNKVFNYTMMRLDQSYKKNYALGTDLDL